MADVRPRPGRHKAARHRAPTAFDRARTRAGDGLRSLPRPVVVAAVSTGLVATSAVAGTAVLGGNDSSSTPTASSSGSSSPTQDRTRSTVSRADERPSLADLKADALADEATGAGRHRGATRVSQEELATADSDPRDIARAMLPQYGWSESEFYCLDELWIGESDWQWWADNPTSSAYGIPQALPAEKMATAGPDWETNPATQIEWGLGYIRDVYGTPCAANAFKNANNWY